MATAVASMYAYLEHGFVYTAAAGLALMGLIFLMWVGRNL